MKPKKRKSNVWSKLNENYKRPMSELTKIEVSMGIDAQNETQLFGIIEFNVATEQFIKKAFRGIGFWEISNSTSLEEMQSLMLKHNLTGEMLDTKESSEKFFLIQRGGKTIYFRKVTIPKDDNGRDKRLRHNNDDSTRPIFHTTNQENKDEHISKDRDEANTEVPIKKDRQ